MLMTNNFYKTCDNVDAVVKTLKMFAKKLFKWLGIINQRQHTWVPYDIKYMRF